MPNIFDLSKISALVKDQQPTRILVMDTNVLMNDPDYNKWSAKAEGQSLFVLSDTVVQELEFIRRKEGSREKADSRSKAEVAINSLVSLFQRGSITQGIPVKAGWVIGVPSPRKDDLDPELKQLEDIVSAFKRSDTKLLLLTRDCHQLFKSIPVTLITGDRGLFANIQMQGVPCHLFNGFPIEVLETAAATKKPVDWDQVLDEIQGNARQKAVTVEATLTVQKLAPPWLTFLTHAKPFMIAEGCGAVRFDDEVRPFLWTISFYPQTLDLSSSSDNEVLADLPSIHLDFFGKDDLEQDLFDAIADRLSDCINMSFEEGTPTLQSPQSIMEMLIYFEYLEENGMSEGALDSLTQEIKDSEGLIPYWTDWILRMENEDEQYASLETLIAALNNCWKIGQTYTFSIIKG
jgi:hypothetical protein